MIEIVKRQVEGNPPLPEADHPAGQQGQQHGVVDDADERPVLPPVDASVPRDMGTTVPPVTGGGMGGGACAASGQPGQGAWLYLLVLSVVGLRARRRIG